MYYWRIVFNWITVCSMGFESNGTSGRLYIIKYFASFFNVLFQQWFIMYIVQEIAFIVMYEINILRFSILHYIIDKFKCKEQSLMHHQDSKVLNSRKRKIDKNYNKFKLNLLRTFAALQCLILPLLSFRHHTVKAR